MKKILVLDDDEQSVEIATTHLHSAGYEVLTAPDGLAGLKLIIARRPDLILSDIWMPVGNGLSVAQRLGELGLGNIPIIFLTAGKEHGLREAAQRVGAVGFFEKPYDSKELLETVAEALK
jgi:CheY-like chemotaxis protein